MTRENLFSLSSLQTNVKYVWTVIPKTTPKVIRKCSRCEQDKFCSSDKFRINANKKRIDVWLIYKCIHCEFTFNLPIIARTAVSKIEDDLLSRLYTNDTTLCWQYAFDANFFQNSIKIDWDIGFDFQEQCPNNREAFGSETKIQILVQSEYNLRIPIFSILRSKMQLSRSQLEKLLNSTALEVFNANGDLLNLKTNLGKGCILKVSRDII
jgi:hypothetical protein